MNKRILGILFFCLCLAVIISAASLGTASAQVSGCDQAEIGLPGEEGGCGGGPSGGGSGATGGNGAESNGYNGSIPAVEFIELEAVSLSQAANHYPTSQAHSVSLPEKTREHWLVILADGLGANQVSSDEYVQNVYNYVKSNIEVEFRYGLSKGALGAVLDQSGTLFDQAELMVDLLRHGGIEANYLLGDVSMSATAFGEWSGLVYNLDEPDQAFAVSQSAACQFMANGGIPVSFQGSTRADCDYSGELSGATAITMGSIAVSANGKLYHPALKKHFLHTGIDLDQAMQCGSDCVQPLRQAIGGSSSSNGVPYKQNIDQQSIEDELVDFATTLADTIRQDYHGHHLEQIVGGQRIDHLHPELGDVSFSTSQTWAGEIPDAYRTQITINYASVFDLTYYADEIYGERINVVPMVRNGNATNADTFHTTSKLYIGPTLIEESAEFLVTDARRQLDITVKHPYASDIEAVEYRFTPRIGNAIYNSSFDRYEQFSNDIAFVFLFGRTGSGHVASLANLVSTEASFPTLEVHENCIAEWEASGIPVNTCGLNDSARIMSELNQMAIKWGEEVGRLAKLQEGLSQSRIQHHASIGFIENQAGAGSGFSPLNIQSRFNLTPKGNSSVAPEAAKHTFAMFMNALEGGVARRQNNFAESASVPGMIKNANRDHIAPSIEYGGVDWHTDPHRFLMIDASNLSAALSQLQGYDADRKNFVQRLVQDGFTIVLPREGEVGGFFVGDNEAYHQRMRENGYPIQPASQPFQWNLIPVYAFKDGGDSVSALLLTSRGKLYVRKGGGSGGNTPPEIIAASYEEAAEAADFFSRHTVNFSNGSLQYQPAPDLVTGSGEFPKSLSFQRSYDSSSRITQSNFVSSCVSFGPGSPGEPNAACSAEQQTAVGWSHNWQFGAQMTSDASQGLGIDSALDASSVIAALQAANAVNTGTLSLQSVLLNSFIANWFDDQLFYNVVNIEQAGSTSTFVRSPDWNTYYPPNATNSVLVKRASSYQHQRLENAPNHLETRYDVDFELTSASGDTLYFGEPGAGPDIAGRLHSWTFPTGDVISFDYNIEANTVKVSNNLGRFIEIVSDQGGNISDGVSLNGGEPLITHVRDDSGRETFYKYEVFAPGAFTQVGITATFANTYTISEYTNARGDVTLYEYEPIYQAGVSGIGAPPGSVYLNNDAYNAGLRAVYAPDDHSTPILRFSFDSLGRVTGTRNKLDKEWHYRVGGISNEEMRFGQTEDPLGYKSTQYLHSSGQVRRAISARGAETLSRFDGLGRSVESLLREVDWSPGAYLTRTTSVYDEFSNVIESRVHTRTVDEIGIAANGEVVFAPDSSPPLITTRTFGIPGFPNLLLTETDPFGTIVTDNEYFAGTGLMRRSRGPSGEEMSYTYNSFGQPLTTTQKLNAAGETLVTQFGYNNSNGNLTSVTADVGGLNLISSFGYDAAGNLILVTDPKNYVTTAAYDEMRRIESVRDHNGGGADYTYDDRGLLIHLDTLTEYGGITRTGVTYSPTGRPLTVAEPSLELTTYTYNARDELETTTDPDGLVTKQLYYPDGLTRAILKGVGTPLEQTEVAFWYDARGELVRHRPARGNRLGDDPNDPAQAIYDNVYKFDTYGRATGMIYPDGSSEVMELRTDGLTTKRYVRAPDATPLSARDYVEYTYDVSKRVTGQQEVHASTDGAIRRTRTMAYDLAGRVLSERETGGSDARDDNAGADEVVTYAYDALSRILSETASGRTVAYQYDDNGNRTQIMWPDGFAVNYRYDALNRLDLVTQDDGDGQLSEVDEALLADYTYDLRSRMKDGMMGNSSLVSFGYNTDSELTSLLYDVSTEAGAAEALAWDYGYTPAGRLAQTALLDLGHPEWSPTESTRVSYGSANVLDQYTAVDGRGTISYDARGNLTGDERGRSYAYDLYNRLTGAVVGGVPIIYDYDVAGRRVGKSVGGQETRFLHAGDMEIAEYDDAGTLLRRYIPGGAVDQRVAMVEGASVNPAPSDLRYYHADRLGNVAALTDGTGRVTDRYAYDPFGNEITGAATSGNPFRYTGRRYDPETGLYFYRARYYDAPLGRFLQTDPIGYADQWNLYTYVANDPLNATDPSGLLTCDDKVCTTEDGTNTITRGSEIRDDDWDKYTNALTKLFNRNNNEFEDEYVRDVEQIGADTNVTIKYHTPSSNDKFTGEGKGNYARGVIYVGDYADWQYTVEGFENYNGPSSDKAKYADYSDVRFFGHELRHHTQGGGYENALSGDGERNAITYMNDFLEGNFGALSGGRRRSLRGQDRRRPPYLSRSRQ